MGMLACEDSRVLDFLLADTDFPEVPEQRAKMRPYILLIEFQLNKTATTPWLRDAQEGGHC